MIFNELTYFFLFLTPSAALFYGAKPSFKPWILTLFGISFFTYYGYLHFGGLWGALCVLIFLWELFISRFYKPGSKWCIFGILQSILILVLFKYLVFFSIVWTDVAHFFNLPALEPLHRFILPLGVSFFTFEFIHFAVESYRGVIQKPLLSRYAAFIFFFPSMVSGPIKRYPEFEKELIQAKATPALLSQGITRILVGLAKKHVLADTLSLWSSQLNTDLISTAPRLSVLMWVLAYGLKIYFDFSGYSDIAIGSGYCFGIKLPENFNWPYLSSNISEFWRRWHISLGRWLFDYIYAPLGGSKKGSLSASRNLLITFGVSGLWHGASYHFVVWGLWHGFLVVMHRAWKAWAHPRSIYIHRIFSIILTYLLVNLGWVFFCVEFSQGLKIFSRLFKFWGIS